MAASTVTERTSIVLVSSIGTIVYLSSVGYPGHLVTIKDYTGVASQGNPIVVSTLANVGFADGSISTLLYDPFSALTVSSKTPNVWQVLNTVGFLTSLSNSFVETLTVENTILKSISTGIEVVSSSVLGAVTVRQSLDLAGSVDILGDLRVSGSVYFGSSLTVSDQVLLSSALTVAGSVRLDSTLSVQDEIRVGGTVSTTASLTVKGDATISTSLYTAGALLPLYLSVQTLTVDALTLGGGLQLYGSLSTTSLQLASRFVSLSSLQTLSSITVGQTTEIQGDTSVRGLLQTVALEAQSSGTVMGDGSAFRLQLGGALSTASSLIIHDTLTVEDRIVASRVQVTGNVVTNSLVVGGSAEFSSIYTSGSVSVAGSLFITKQISTGFLAATQTTVRDALLVDGAARVETASTLTGGLSSETDLRIGGTLVVAQDTYAGSITSQSSLTVVHSFTTNSLYSEQSILVAEDFNLGGTAVVGALAAPVEIVLSTLTASNAVTITNVGSIPVFLVPTADPTTIPSTIIAGPSDTFFQGFAKAPSMNIRNTLQQYTSNGDSNTIGFTILSSLTGIERVNRFGVGDQTNANPLRISTTGTIYLGSNINGSNVYRQPESGLLTDVSLQFSNLAYSAFNSNGLWVAVGEAATPLTSIQVSRDGAESWAPIVSGGFDADASGVCIVRDVSYFSPTNQWVATGQGTGTSEMIQYSADGSNWSNANPANLFPPSEVGGRCVVSDPSSGYVMVGGSGGIANFGILYSQTGTSWSAATASLGQPFDCKDILSLNGLLLAVGQDLGSGSNTIFQPLGLSTSGNPSDSWLDVGSNVPGQLSTLVTIAGNETGTIVIGGTGQGGDPLYSIWYTTAGLYPAYNSIQSGGFSDGVERIRWDTTTKQFVAVGSNSGGQNVQVSQDGIFWTSLSDKFPSRLYAVAFGPLSVPDTITPIFLPNVEVQFASGISTQVAFTVSTVIASSIEAIGFSGDASLLSNISQFGSRLGVSTLQLDTLAWTPLYTNILDLAASENRISPSSLFSTVTANTLLAVPNFSTLVEGLWLGAGRDVLSTGTIQTAINSSNWIRSLTGTFTGYGTAIQGNGISYAPFYVATGADTRTNYTIQTSQNGTTWAPVTSGGFTTITSNELKEGTTVATLLVSSITRWLVGGKGPSLLTSDNGTQFTEAPANPLFGSFLQRIKSAPFPAEPVALALNSANQILRSTDGLTWTATDAPQASAFAYGDTTAFGSGWVCITATGTFYYSATGLSWILVGTPTLPTLTGVIDLLWTGAYWLALTPTTVYQQFGPNLNAQWVAPSSPFTGTTALLSIYSYGPEVYIGAEAQVATNTLWKSINGGISFSPIPTGGFSTATIAFGVGYGLAISSPYVLVGGSGTFGTQLPMNPQILRAFNLQSPQAPNPYAEGILSQTNASNVFATSVYGVGIASTNTQLYPFVAVGDGLTPQKTIARSSNLTDWVPAITGGFSTGQAITYYSNPSISRSVWLAVGTSPASTATIQYSADGANWFATNQSQGIPYGGYGITVLSSLQRAVVVGAAPDNTNPAVPNQTIVYSDDGFTWSSAGNFQGFQRAGYGIASGHKSGTTLGPSGEGLIAVGRPTSSLASTTSIQWSPDGISWQSTVSGGFPVAGYGVAYGTPYGIPTWVAVGQISELADPPTSLGTIQYSTDGETWSNAITGFKYGGFGVAYDSASSVFVATGKSGVSNTSILYSSNGQSWDFLQTGGFSNQQQFGRASGLFAQLVETVEINPFVEFPNLFVYSRSAPRTYTVPTIRFQSTTVVLNEATAINLSSQITINTDTPVGSNTVTVNGSVQTSSFIYRGSEPQYGTIFISSLVASSIQFTTYFNAATFTTPSWGFVTSTLANRINVIETGSNQEFYTVINDTLYVKKGIPGYAQQIGINTSTPSTELDVVGTVACSTLSSAIYRQSQVSLSRPNQVSIESPLFVLASGTTSNPQAPLNSIVSDVSSLTFNSILTVNQSTQRVGYCTSNPLFGFDSRRAGWISSLTTQTVRTETLFFTLQSF